VETQFGDPHLRNSLKQFDLLWGQPPSAVQSSEARPALRSLPP
jgi:hypothetical protein